MCYLSLFTLVMCSQVSIRSFRYEMRLREKTAQQAAINQVRVELSSFYIFILSILTLILFLSLHFSLSLTYIGAETELERDTAWY
jgi:hypothetical protein